MFRGLATFKKDLQGFAEEVPRGGIKAVREVAKGWFAEIVSLTPRDTGFAKSLWKYSINVKPPTEVINNPRSRGPYAAAATPAFSTLRPDGRLYIYNNVAYIKRLEEGYSDQAPRNFVKNSTARANYKLQSEFDKL